MIAAGETRISIGCPSTGAFAVFKPVSILVAVKFKLTKLSRSTDSIILLEDEIQRLLTIPSVDKVFMMPGKKRGVRYFLRSRGEAAAKIDPLLGDEITKLANDSGLGSSPEQLLHTCFFLSQ
jgi:hypothetical protein